MNAGPMDADPPFDLSTENVETVCCYMETESDLQEPADFFRALVAERDALKAAVRQAADVPDPVIGDVASVEPAPHRVVERPEGMLKDERYSHEWDSIHWAAQYLRRSLAVRDAARGRLSAR